MAQDAKQLGNLTLGGRFTVYISLYVSFLVDLIEEKGYSCYWIENYMFYYIVASRLV